MDSRAKQRLTGAVILVALFVLLVPALLTGPRKADVPEGAATDEGMRRYTIDLDAAAPPAQADTSAAQAPVALPPVADDRAQPGDEATPATSEPAAAAATSAAPRAATPKAPASQPVPTQVASTPAVATPATAAPAAAVAHGNFVVQLGTFGSRENADKLVRDMTTKGFAAFIAPYTKEGHELYRVRVGPTRDRAAAEALAAQLHRIGQPGSVVPIS